MRRSQLGYVTMCGCAPITWSSKVTTVRFREYDAPAGYSWGRPVVANSGIADNHADVSSAASELYAAGTCVMDVLALSYVASEANVAFPSPFVLQVDNAAGSLLPGSALRRLRPLSITQFKIAITIIYFNQYHCHKLPGYRRTHIKT